jgi:hypothetical protein
MNLKLSSTIDYLRMLEGYAEGILDRGVSLAINTKGVLVATDGDNMAYVSIDSRTEDVDIITRIVEELGGDGIE